MVFLAEWGPVGLFLFDMWPFWGNLGQCGVGVAMVLAMVGWLVDLVGRGGLGLSFLCGFFGVWFGGLLQGGHISSFSSSSSSCEFRRGQRLSFVCVLWTRYFKVGIFWGRFG